MNLPTPPPNDPNLEQLLQAHADRNAPLADDGFTVRVLQALPPIKPTPRSFFLHHQRTLLCLLGATGGLIVGGYQASNQQATTLIAWLEETLRQLINPSQPSSLLTDLLTTSTQLNTITLLVVAAAIFAAVENRSTND